MLASEECIHTIVTVKPNGIISKHKRMTHSKLYVLLSRTTHYILN